MGALIITLPFVLYKNTLPDTKTGNLIAVLNGKYLKLKMIDFKLIRVRNFNILIIVVNFFKAAIPISASNLPQNIQCRGLILLLISLFYSCLIYLFTLFTWIKNEAFKHACPYNYARFNSKMLLLPRFFLNIDKRLIKH